MLVVAAATIQVLLLADLLLRRLLFLCIPSKRPALQRFADNAALSSFAAVVLQTATVPLQAAASVVATVGRFWAMIVLAFLCFAGLLMLSTSAVYAYTVLARMYNVGVAPVVMAGQWLSVLLDFVFRAVVPLWNGIVFFWSEVLRKVVLPYSFHNIETLPEILQGLTLMLVSLGASVRTWLANLMECTLLHEDALRVCGVSSEPGLRRDCTTMFTATYTQCFASPNHLTLDLVTPGLFGRQAVLALRRVVASHCGVAALVLNLLLFPLAELHLYTALHTGVNFVLFAVIGLPVTTVRRCEAARAERGGAPLSIVPLSRVHEVVACTPDWQPLTLMATAALESVGEVINSWMNAAALLARDRIAGGEGGGGSSCEPAVRMSGIVLDAARAIEGLESVDALERLQGKRGLPDSETLLRVRVVGITPRLFGVTDGKAVLYRGAHDGYVWAYGAWPFAVDVRLGLAAVSYSGSATETDSSGDARTGLLGCRCVDEEGFALLCATAPYVQHIDNDGAGLNASAMHLVSFPGLSLLGMKCSSTAVRVLPLRWPRKRLASTEGDGGSGYGGYQRFSYTDIGRRLQGDTDATDTLRLLERKYRSTQAGAVEAAIFVQPVCGDGGIACALAAHNCFPWCMGVVRGGARAQNVTMFNTDRWESHVLLPDVDCGVRRQSAAREQGACGSGAPNTMPNTIVDMMTQAGVVTGDCLPENMCTPSPVAAVVASLVRLDALDSTQGSDLGLVREHKRAHWLGVRMEKQPFVVAGDVLLNVGEDTAGRAVVVVTRLYDIGHGSLQMAGERLTLTSNSHAIEIAECSTQADRPCIEQAMADGRVVLPLAFYIVRDAGRPAEHTDGGEVAGLLPAAASRWAVHWAANPELTVYSALFDFCRDKTRFDLLVHSSFGPALVWTLHTMRAVDLEGSGVPSEDEVKSRVSYMRVPEFFGDFFAEEATAGTYCGVVVGLKIVGVEYVNAENVLLTVLAARPEDYDPYTGAVTGPRTYRYYFLHPSRHDCVDGSSQAAGPIFSCWRSQDSGMWPSDTMLSGGPLGASLAAPAWDSENTPCVQARVVPAFGSALVMPAVALVSALETALDALCTLTALVVARPSNPAEAMRELTTVALQRPSFHSMADSAGARLLNVEDIIAASEWCARFNAHIAIYAVNAFSSAVSSLASDKLADKTLAGMRTLVVGAAKVQEGSRGSIPQFKQLESMFEQPIAFSAVHASTAVLSMADGLEGKLRLPLFVSAFMRTQVSMVGTLALVLRLGRVTVLRLLQTGALAPAAVASAALLESQSIVKSDFLDVMRSQCYGLAQMLGTQHEWGAALRHLCLLLPDTLEGVLTVVTVLTLDYPTVACACKLGDGDTLGGSALDAVTRICLLRPLPIEETQWLNALALAQWDRRDVCFVTMDRANARFRTAFDKAHQRMYQMTQHAAGIADGLLSVITGDSAACDAFDVSPYVLSIIPEPVDYFSACVDTDDCKVRCLEEYAAFDDAKQKVLMRGVTLGLSTSIPVTLESQLFSAEDIENGRNLPPFLIQDVVELPRSSCSVVCAAAWTGTRCLVLAGLRTSAEETTPQLGLAYYCLPLDVSQYAFQWPGMEASTLPAPGAAGGFPALPGLVTSLHIATTWAAQESMRDFVVAVVRVVDRSLPDDTELVLEPLTQVLLFVQNREVPLLIMRTSTRGERQLEVDVELPRSAGWLHKIEHVQMDVADRRGSAFVVQARGYRMTRARIADSDQFMWQLPKKACVRCEVTVHGISVESAVVDCNSECVGHTGEPSSSAEAETAEFDFVLAHTRVCLREHGADERVAPSPTAQSCVEFIALPRQVPDTALGPAAYAKMHLRVLDNGMLLNKEVRIPENVVAMLRVDAVQRAYRDMQQQVQVRVALLSRVHYMSAPELALLRALAAPESSESSDTEESAEAVALEIITCNARNVHGNWLHVLLMRVDSAGATGALRNGLRADTQAVVRMSCDLHNCGACAHSSGQPQTDGELVQLENMCYAAKQCGVERCAGTMVNMRKPLCNLGKVLTSELHSVRVLLQAVWRTLADKIAMTVELTHQRREKYEILWPSRSMRQTTCTAKDSIVSMAATLTSILGAVSHIMQDVSLENEHAAAKLDARVHARYIMVLAATTNMLSAVMLWPVYQMIVLEKFVACTESDVMSTVMNVVDAAGNGRLPQLSIKFGDSMQDAAQSSGVATCITEDVKQSLEDAGAQVEDAGSGSAKQLRGSRRITRIIADAISGTIDTLLAAKVQFFYHVADIWFAWAAGVIKGVMDIAQTVDWENCKLPVVDRGMRSLGGCACDDAPYSIPQRQKTAAWKDTAFWCSGLLMLNEGDGSDKLVWNPFSLEQLLQMPGERDEKTINDLVRVISERMSTASDYSKYVICLQTANSGCEYFKPQHTRLAQQGVDVMQVVSRCRENYKQARWDEASALYALFSADEWRTADKLELSESAHLDDSYTQLRKKIIKITNQDKRFWSAAEKGVALHSATWACLSDAVRAGALQHNCHRASAPSAFEYVRAADTLSSNTDACRVAASSRTKRFPRMLWSGSSTNHVPVARLHPVQKLQENRSSDAYAKLRQLIDTEIKPLFTELISTDFSASLRQHLDVNAFSVEGDQLHQLVDCVVLGPFAAAELHANVHSAAIRPLPVPTYHRGRSSSREFSSWGRTGGSDARKALIRDVLAHVDEHAQGILLARVNAQVLTLADRWLNIDNFLCSCLNAPPAMACCVYSKREDIRFGLSLDENTWDIGAAVIQDTFAHVVASRVLDNIWLQRIGEPLPLGAAERSEAQAAHLFAAAGTTPVRTYGSENSLAVLNNASLWEWCTSRVAGLFATLPLTDEETNEKEGRAPTSSVPDVASSDYEYDPAQDEDDAPSRDSSEARRHSMELVIDKLLRRSRELAPHFWTHAHRYVASDSVWCEGEPSADAHVGETRVPASLHQQPLRQERVLAPDMNDLVYPADVLRRCACGWGGWETGCFIPAEVCQNGRVVLADPLLGNSQLADGRSRSAAWATLCSSGADSGELGADSDAGYSSTADLLVLLQVLGDLSADALRNCSAREVSTAWGLLAPHQHDAWYAGEAGATQLGGTWEFGAQHLATAGPGGLRLGMLSPSEQLSMQEYVRAFELGDRLSGTVNARYEHTIGQPVCNSTLQRLLREELDEYFVDTLIPMAHSVQIVPAVEYCVRWVLEYAMLAVLQHAEGEALSDEGEELSDERRRGLRVLVSKQEIAAEQWRERCSVQMRDIGVCALRGVYDIAPPEALVAPAACAFAGGAAPACTKHYYTSGCLLFCDGTFYDPCKCESQDAGSECKPLPFSQSSCLAGALVDGRALLLKPLQEGLLTTSMMWPETMLVGEAASDSDWESLRDALALANSFPKHGGVGLHSVFDAARSALLARPDLEEVPHSYCDDLMDYWPDVQHPVGYHPTTACSAQETHTRGFTSWMSRSEDGTPLLDPVRMRNASLASQVFGAAHLVCDAHAYAAPGHRLNPYYMQSKWKQDAHADPAIPKNAPAVTLDDMPFLGSPSLEETDTTFRAQGHPADALAQHSVGLVRAWALWVAPSGDRGDRDAGDAGDAGDDRDAEHEAETQSMRAEGQRLLDSSWPHWTHDTDAAEASGLFLSSRGSVPPPGCSFPELALCDDNVDCVTASSTPLKCLKSSVSQRGVCMQENTCFEHSHCSAQGMLCSGEGQCAAPVIRVRNEARVVAEVQLFAHSQCDVSMRRLSPFENIPDFAAANGMCSFRNWFHFQNATADTTAFQDLIEVRDRLLHHTDKETPATLHDMHVLKTLPHPCDSTYAHTDYNACHVDALITTDTDSRRATDMRASKTWALKDVDGELLWHARFCDMRPRGSPTGFLHPYLPDTQTLHSAATDIRRCTEFMMCPFVHFHVGGRTVDTRRVRSYIANEDSPYGVQAVGNVGNEEVREYCGLDAQRCWGMGYLLGIDCVDVDKELSELCIVDTLVLPLVDIIFGGARPGLGTLQQHCPRAFTLPFRGKKDNVLFDDVEYYLTRPYKWTDEATRERVLQYSNSLLWFLFGMTEEKENTQHGDGRGFSTVEQYIQHAQCAVYLARQLQLNQQRLNTGSSIYQNSWATSNVADGEPALPVLAGASLYVFLESVPVGISLRWFTQCVALAKNSDEGGVETRLLARINAGGGFAIVDDYIECENYLLGIANHDVDGAANPNSSLPLHQWLRTAPFLFMLLDSTDDADTGMHARQINSDVTASIAFAIEQLGVFEMPDLLCVGPLENWGVLTSTANIRHNNLLRFEAPGLDKTVVGGFVTDSVSNTSLHKQVLDFLTAGTSYVWDVETPVVTVQELLSSGVLRRATEDMDATVVPKEVYPEFEYEQLQPHILAALPREDMLSEEEYVYAAEDSQGCRCGQQVRDCRKLREPEYAMLTPNTCSGSKILECTEDVVRLLDERLQHSPPFLQQHEALYLLLLIFKNHIQNTVSGGFMALHRLRSPAGDVQAVSEMFGVLLPRQAERVSFVEAKQFNEFVRNRKALSWKCKPTAVDWQAQTNFMHSAMRQCRNGLQEKIGWEVPASLGGITKTLELQPRAQSMLSGFFPAFLFRDRAAEHKTFLDTLLDTKWTLSEFAEYERAVCQDVNGDVTVMAPFWAELFDVGTNVAGEDSAMDPPIACDMLRSSYDSKLMVYSSLCAASASSTRSCAEHPEYEQHIINTLPAICAQKHGHSIVRSRLGALKRGLTPLCELRPTAPATCALKHGALHGHQGSRVQDLDTATPVRAVEVGFWKLANSIFRGFETVRDSELVPALALAPADIGGHCLEFSISEQGWLYLHRARLTTSCQQTGGHVRRWLQNIEQDWAWEHAHAKELVGPSRAGAEQVAAVSWSCPLHWLQHFHDDDSKHQARGPSWRRNQARFAHITGEYAYAHPTVRNTYKLRGVRAARWMSDTMACVAVHESECHAAEHLSSTLQTLLAPSSLWHSVAYVPAEESECPRVLDWPSDCGVAAYGGTAQGQCFMRQ